MTSSVNKRSTARTVGAAVAAASRAAAGGRCAAAGIWVVWMRETRVVSCESVPRLDNAVPVNRPNGVDTAVVVAVAPSRLSEPVIGRARVIVDYLDGLGLDVRTAHARALHQGALWTSLRGPAEGGVVGPTSSVPMSMRRHRWLPGFGACAHPRLVTAALAPLAAVVLAAPAAHSAPLGQPGVISEPQPGQAGVTGRTAPQAPDSPEPVVPGYIEQEEGAVIPAPAQNPAPISPAPQLVPESEPQAVPEQGAAPEPEVIAESQVIPEAEIAESDMLPEPQAPAVAPQPDMASEPQSGFTPQPAPVDSGAPALIETAPQPVIADNEPGVSEETVPLPVDGTTASEDRLYFGGASVPQPEWMTPQAAQWERDWNAAVVTEAAETLAQTGSTDPAVEAVLGVDTEPMPLPEAVAPVVEAVPEPIVNDVESMVDQPAAELAAVVEPPLAQVVNEVLPQWPPAFG